MKKILYMLLVLLGMGLCPACGGSDSEGGEDDSPLLAQLAGDWHLATWNAEAPEDFDAYVSFGADRTFTIYQRIESVRYVTFTGTFRLDGTSLTGVYSDGQVWGGTYEVSFDAAGNTMTLVSDSSLGEVHVYVRSSIPASVKSVGTAVRTAELPEKFRLL